MQTSVEYHDYIIDAKALHATPAKIEAILRSFVNYYGKFIQNMSTLVHPLNNLLQHSTSWNWSQECENAFQQLKRKLACARVLVHYNPSLPLRLACNASAYGHFTCIPQWQRRIAYASRTLTSSEKNYVQIEIEKRSLV